MSPGARVGIGVVVALASMGALGALTRLEYTATGAEAAELRLAWRARVPRVEECRRLTQEEQEALPAHMRRGEVCEGRVASYRLAVEVDGRTVRSTVVEGAGARGDRPLYVFEAVPIPPGEHDLGVTFERLERATGTPEPGPAVGAAPGSTPRPERPETGSSERAPEAGSQGRTDVVPDRLVLRRSVEVGPRDVVLVTYAPDRRRLELRRAGGRE